jgi:hypothetical protein
MPSVTRHKLLFGPYTMPRCRLGKKLFCEIRGWVPVKRISNGRIPWPQTVVGRNRAFILCGDLAKAVRRESNIAVCFWWGVTPQTVTVWRKALDVPVATEGTSRLFRLTAKRMPQEVRARAIAGCNTPEANAKKSAAKLGKPRPAHVREAIRQANLGRKLSIEIRRKMSEAHKRRGTWPPTAGRPWTERETALLSKAPDEEIARRIKRTVCAVEGRRQRLKIRKYNSRGRGFKRAMHNPVIGIRNHRRTEKQHER